MKESTKKVTNRWQSFFETVIDKPFVPYLETVIGNILNNNKPDPPELIILRGGPRTGKSTILSAIMAIAPEDTPARCPIPTKRRAFDDLYYSCGYIFVCTNKLVEDWSYLDGEWLSAITGNKLCVRNIYMSGNRITDDEYVKLVTDIDDSELRAFGELCKRKSTT